MILVYALIFILFEAISEGVIKRYYYPRLSEIVFKGWVQWLIAIILFAVWFLLMLGFDRYYVPIWKLICGFIFVRYLIFDTAYNLSAGNPVFYIGNKKLYDKILQRMGLDLMIFTKGCFGFIGIVFLIGKS